MAKKAGIGITPAQMVSHWTHALHKYQLNVWNFEVEAAKAAVGVFQESFELGRFNTNGSTPWANRKRNYKHPILKETSTLKNSLTWKYKDGAGYKLSGVTVFTDPTKFETAARHKGYCYAAIHNEGIGRMPQRQFMGHSSVLDDKIKSMFPKIFAGLP